MSEEITGYKLSRQWFDYCFENPDKVRPVHTAIYFFAIEHCNRLGWKKKFGFPSQMAMEAVGVKNWRTYIKAFNEIVDWGFFELVEKSKNQYSSNIIAIVKNTKASTKALDKALQKHSQKHSQKQGNSTVGINKQRNKEQYNRQSEIAEEFELFWNLYDKKKEKPKCEKKWNRLKESERKQILEHVPMFVRAHSEWQYRPYPAKYLNNRMWEDEHSVRETDDEILVFT